MLAEEKALLVTGLEAEFEAGDLFQARRRDFAVYQ